MQPDSSTTSEHIMVEFPVENTKETLRAVEKTLEHYCVYTTSVETDPHGTRMTTKLELPVRVAESIIVKASGPNGTIIGYDVDKRFARAVRECLRLFNLRQKRQKHEKTPDMLKRLDDAKASNKKLRNWGMALNPQGNWSIDGMVGQSYIAAFRRLNSAAATISGVRRFDSMDRPEFDATMDKVDAEHDLVRKTLGALSQKVKRVHAGRIR